MAQDKAINYFVLIPIIVDAVKGAIVAIEKAKSDDGKLDASEVFTIVWAFAQAIINGMTTAPKAVLAP